MQAQDPKEKAIELVYETFRKAINVSKYHLRHDPNNLHKSKRCALSSVDEILNFTVSNCCEFQNRKYWEEVRNQIENL